MIGQPSSFAIDGKTFEHRKDVLILSAGAVPLVLGGDHSITEPDVRACAAVHGPLGLIHFDAHTDTATTLYGQELSHGTPTFFVDGDAIMALFGAGVLIEAVDLVRAHPQNRIGVLPDLCQRDPSARMRLRYSQRPSTVKIITMVSEM